MRPLGALPPVVATSPSPELLDYATTKAGIIAFTAGAAAKLSPNVASA